MKAVYTKEFWQSRWDKMMERVPGDFYMNLEEDLNREVKPIEEALKENNISVTDENHKTLLRLKAKGIADKAEKKCKEQMAMIQRINNGQSSLGYTTEQQEIHARAELHKRFEFNCYQLSVFKEKYLT